MDYARMRAIADELMEHAPEPIAGVEITPDGIIMTMSPSGTHELVAWKLRRQLDRQIPDTLAAHTGGDVEDPSIGILRRPDLVVLPVAAMDTPGPFHPRDLTLAAEIVSPSNHANHANHANDYAQKMHDYPAMGIPFYLLVDPRKGIMAVMSDPGPGADGQPRYRARHDYAFGDSVVIGQWTVDSAEFPLYQS
ncbi:Uma2 family endonuclease [Streptomyces sp. ISL-11]|uniref:Uma2 family endonuclease n=1 Tax=Streptomyces sp. ISL-11 TaxID=2819174 RepID=UPI001BE87E37|nr:Uma2 family endonuclease [Streptomyces sp. ISL-11]MBT2384076.1 Uma2 family endonuclease [Streptomyces sp. ISL-11]